MWDPYSQFMNTEHTLAPHLEYCISNNVTLVSRSTFPNATPGTYSAHTRWTHLKHEVQNSYHNNCQDFFSQTSRFPLKNVHLRWKKYGYNKNIHVHLEIAAQDPEIRYTFPTYHFHVLFMVLFHKDRFSLIRMQMRIEITDILTDDTWAFPCFYTQRNEYKLKRLLKQSALKTQLYF